MSGLDWKHWSPEECAAAEVVERQVDAYNLRDLDGLCACFAEDVLVYQLGVESPIIEGREAYRATYARSFQAEPHTLCTVERREVFGRYVTDFETLAGYLDGQARSLCAIYEVSGGFISRVWFRKGPGSLGSATFTDVFDDFIE